MSQFCDENELDRFELPLSVCALLRMGEGNVVMDKSTFLLTDSRRSPPALYQQLVRAALTDLSSFREKRLSIEDAMQRPCISANQIILVPELLRQLNLLVLAPSEVLESYIERICLALRFWPYPNTAEMNAQMVPSVYSSTFASVIYHYLRRLIGNILTITSSTFDSITDTCALTNQSHQPLVPSRGHSDQKPPSSDEKKKPLSSPLKVVVNVVHSLFSCFPQLRLHKPCLSEVVLRSSSEIPLLLEKPDSLRLYVRIHELLFSPFFFEVGHKLPTHLDASIDLMCVRKYQIEFVRQVADGLFLAIFSFSAFIVFASIWFSPSLFVFSSSFLDKILAQVKVVRFLA